MSYIPKIGEHVQIIRNSITGKVVKLYKDYTIAKIVVEDKEYFEFYHNLQPIRPSWLYRIQMFFTFKIK